MPAPPPYEPKRMSYDPMRERYVAVVHVPGGALYCSDQFRDEWTGNLGYAETFRALHEAIEVAQRHGGQAMLYRDAHLFGAPEGAAPAAT